MRSPGDPAYKTGTLEVNDETEQLISQIKMILYTRPAEVLGATDFGIDLEGMLFVQNMNEYSLKGMLHDQVLKFIPMAERFQISFDVKFARGTVRDICLIDVRINGNPVFGVIVK